MFSSEHKKMKGVLNVFVLFHSFATAEEPKRKSCNSLSTHMDRFLPATRTQGTAHAQTDYKGNF